MPRASQSKHARIVLVDDHPLVRERLAEMLNREPDLRVCGEAEDRQGALSVIATSKPDLAIVDLTLKDSHGLDLIKDIQARWPALAVLVVSMHEESLHAERAIRAGARGYITKQEATRKILLAVRRVLEGGIYLSDTIAAQLAPKAVGRGDAPAGVSLEHLADRELEVLQWIGRGYSTHEIAERLHLNFKTVETYRARIKDKLGLKDAHEVLQYAIRWHYNL